MGLRDEITPDIIANTIYQDNYNGYNILVEGETDESFFSKFFNDSISQIQICHGKENLVEAIDIINKRVKRKDTTIGIIDKDYDFLDNALEYPHNIVQTDFHDVEMMCLHSQSFDNISKEYFSEEKVSSLLTDKKGMDLRSYLLTLVEPISKLRILNIEENLSLSFKPRKQKKNDKELNYKKFICRKKLEFSGYDDLVNTVKRYRNQAPHLRNDETVDLLMQINVDSYNLYDICHGHDLTRAIGKRSRTI